MKTYYTPKEIKQALKDKKKGERLKKNILTAHSNYLAQFQVHELMDLIECERLSGVDKIIHENNDDDYSINLFRFRFFI
jgi:hypothetical protein